uniref:Uncharacterized protein n=1 Tax=Solanum tuberosum TaxID=4113 RepID=M1DCS2_SOLTU
MPLFNSYELSSTEQAEFKQAYIPHPNSNFGKLDGAGKRTKIKAKQFEDESLNELKKNTVAATAQDVTLDAGHLQAATDRPQLGDH